jgi:type IV pilus assembly protein PilA
MISSTIKRLNDRRDSAEGAGEDAGFTLIELMVVLLILAILLAIAIPTFLGVTKSANDRAAQSNLNTALVNVKSIFQSNSQSYALLAANSTNYTSNNASLVSSLISAEPNLSFATGAVTSGAAPAQISVAIAQDGNGVVLAEQAKGTGNCWFVVDNAVAETAALGGTPYTNLTGAVLAAGTYYGEAKNTGTVPTCSALAPPAPATGTIVYQASGFPAL